MDMEVHIFGYVQNMEKINYWVDDGEILQCDMTLPYYPDLPVNVDVTLD